MRASDIATASADAGVDQFQLCSALRIVRPVLENLRDRQGFIARLFLRGFIAAIDEYVEERCG
jgi:hypothetical protein